MTLLQKKIASIFFILPVFGLIARAEVPSQPYVWKNVKVVAGGFVPAIVFSRVEKGLTYCRTDIGGCYRWDDARRKWLPLTDFMDESSYFGGESIAPDPVDADTVYIAGGMYSSEKAAMLRSRDKGKTWDIFPVSFRMGGNEDGRGMGERLAVDPSDNRILYFGSRYEGLWKSEDSAATWHQVVNFPIKGLGNPNQRGERHGGLSFVLFDATGVEKGSPSKTIFVGCADPGDSHLFRSDNSGKTWFAVEGQPSNKMLPAHAELEDGGILYIAYGSGIGPNGVSDGQVWKLDTQTGQWKNISPEKGPNKPAGGYFGLSLDRQHPGTLGVATMNRWGPGDTIWRTVDGGKTWTDIAERSERNVSLSPYLYWGAQKPRLGWWMSAFAIDPFNSDHAAYGTGATIYATDDFSNTSLDRATHWHVWGEGIEETAVIGLISPTDGPHLVSAFGDIGGFAHDDIDVSPAAGMFLNPLFITTVTIDYAGAQPSVIVRGGQPRDGQAPLAYSEDGGHNWTPLSAPAAAAAGRRGETPGVLVSADGRTFVLLSRTLQFTREQGRVWSPVRGLPTGCRPVADRVNGSIFYCFDFATSKFYSSADGCATFRETPTQGLPADVKSDRPYSFEGAWPLMATTEKAGDLWFVSKTGLFHSTDGGKTFTAVPSALHVEMLSFGKAPSGKDYPALFAIGRENQLRAIWRSDDIGKTWIRVNDDLHQYGTRFRCIAGDPRIFGRVYFGTDGRGILYGDPVK